MNALMDLKDRVALVTGAGGGQGAAHSRVLARAGATVYMTDIVTSGLQREVDQLVQEGCDVHAAALDVSSAASWSEAASTIEVAHGKLDVLVNNAGILDMASFEDATEESWQRTVDVNQKGAFLGIKKTLHLLRKSASASVVNTSSIFAIIGAPDYVAYHATKAALVGLTKSAAATLGTDNIRVNSVHPGYVDTAMWQEELKSLPEGAESEALASIPLRRFAKPDDIAGVVLFLASDASSYVTGTQIIVDGGASSI